MRPLRFVTRKIVSTAVRIAGGSKERLKLGNLNVHRDWGWAPDYVDAMWRILQHEKAEDFVVATGKMHSLRDFVDKTFECLGLSAADHMDSDESLLRPSDITYSVGNPEKAQRVLGWNATVNFEGIIERLVQAEQKAIG